MNITSLENERVKQYVRLKTKKYRDQEGLFLVEGFHLVEEAYKAGLVEEIILLDGKTCDFNSSFVYVTEEIIRKISSMDSLPNILALCKKKKMSTNFGRHLLLLDGIQDPGNLGTIIRSSKAFNVDTIVLGEQCCDLYNPKVLRSTQGMAFHMNIIPANLNEFIYKLKEEQIPIYGTKVDGGLDVGILSSMQKEKYALVMGNEGSGVSSRVLDLCDQYLYIPMNKEVESLNVGVATSILLYELNRR